MLTCHQSSNAMVEPQSKKATDEKGAKADLKGGLKIIP